MPGMGRTTRGTSLHQGSAAGHKVRGVRRAMCVGRALRAWHRTFCLQGTRAQLWQCPNGSTSARAPHLRYGEQCLDGPGAAPHSSRCEVPAATAFRELPPPPMLPAPTLAVHDEDDLLAEGQRERRQLAHRPQVAALVRPPPLRPELLCVVLPHVAADGVVQDEDVPAPPPAFSGRPGPLEVGLHGLHERDELDLARRKGKERRI